MTIRIQLLFLLLFLVTNCKTTKMPPSEALEKLGPNPYFEIDEKAVKHSELSNVDPNQIAAITTYFDEFAVKKYGNKAKDGAVIIITKERATKLFEARFSEISNEYNSIRAKSPSSKIQYILNGQVLIENFEGNLAQLNREQIKTLEVIDSEKLNSKYKVSDKDFGVLIVTKKLKKKKK